MQKASIILAALGGLVFSLSLRAQASSDQDVQWRAKIRPDENNGYSYAPLLEALKIAERFGDGDARLFESLVRLAVFCQDDDDGCEEQASGYAKRALKMQSKVRPKDAHFAALLVDLAGAAVVKDELPLYREALAIRKELFGPEDQSVAETYAAMASAYQWMDDPVLARRTMQTALEIRVRVHKDRTLGYADLLDDSAQLYASAKEPGRALDEYERAIAIRQSIWGVRDPRFVKALSRVAGANRYGPNEGYAEQLFRRIVEIQKSTHTEKSEPYYSALVDLANFLRFKKRYAEAQQAFEDAFAVREKMGKRDVTAAFCMEEIARVRMARARYKDAIEAGEVSVQIRARLEKPAQRDPTAVDALLAEAYLQANNPSKSEAYFQALHNQIGPVAQYTLVETADKLCTIYQERGNYPEAAAKLEVAVASIETKDAADARLPEMEIRLSKLYQSMGRANDANRMSMAAIRAMGRNLKSQGDPARLKYFLIGLVVLMFVPIVGTATFALLLAWMGRKMDRKLALLYCPPADSSEASDQTGADSPHRTFVGGFLGLTRMIEDQAMAAPVTVLAEPAVETPLAVAQIPEPPASQVILHADASDLFAMRVLNLLLSVVTLGICSFWGKAKVRRYVCGQAEYQGDWFAFHGTGRELLFGWLRALPALAFIFLFPTVLPLFWQHRSSPFLAQLCAVLAFLLLWPIARVGAYRYRLNRMSWRAIRFSYRGKAPRYFRESVVGCLLAVVTLGIYVPFFQIRLRKLLLNQTYFGNRVFQFPGRGADLMPAWLCALPFTVCSFGIGWAWWRALSHRYEWANTTFSGGRFRCNVTGGKLLWLWVGNFLVIVLTLGLGMSWAMLRTLRFWTKHIQLVGEPETASIRQDVRAASASGESFADFLGFDFGF